MGFSSLDLTQHKSFEPVLHQNKLNLCAVLHLPPKTLLRPTVGFSRTENGRCLVGGRRKKTHYQPWRSHAFSGAKLEISPTTPGGGGRKMCCEFLHVRRAGWGKDPPLSALSKPRLQAASVWLRMGDSPPPVSCAPEAGVGGNLWV